MKRERMLFRLTTLALLIVFAAGCSEYGVYDLFESQPSGGSGANVDPDAIPDFPDDPWSTSDALYRRRIVIDNRGRSEALAGFPLMVRLDASRINYTQTDGADLRFYDAGGTTEVPYEIERWSASQGSIVWVKVPEIAADGWDYIWMYWGGGVATSFHDAAQVWSAYELVLHMGSNYDDSSPNGWAATPAGGDAPAFETGVAGQAIRLDPSGGAGYLDITEYPAGIGASAQSAYTVEVWMQGDAAPGDAGQSGPVMSQQVSIGWDHGTSRFRGRYHFKDGGGSWTAVPRAAALEPATWYYAAAVFDAGTARSYLDGVLDGKVTDGASTTSTTDYFRIGTDSEAATLFSGLVDEVRVELRARSADWIDAQHDAMIDAMLVFGEAESQ